MARCLGHARAGWRLLGWLAFLTASGTFVPEPPGQHTTVQRSASNQPADVAELAVLLPTAAHPSSPATRRISTPPSFTTLRTDRSVSATMFRPGPERLTGPFSSPNDPARPSAPNESVIPRKAPQPGGAARPWPLPVTADPAPSFRPILAPAANLPRELEFPPSPTPKQLAAAALGEIRVMPLSPAPVRRDASTAPSRIHFTPTFLSTNGDGTQTNMSIPRLLGAGTFYDAGYTGTRAAIANIEGGQSNNTHETLTWIGISNYFAGAGAITPAIQGHATTVSFTMVGKGTSETQHGMAYQVPNGNFFTGNIATKYNPDGSFDSTYNALKDAYKQAMISGVNGVSAQVVDVVNSSYTGYDPTGSGDPEFSRTLDALLYLANQSRGVTQVAAAGNSGLGHDTIGWPAAGYNTLAVGALGATVGSPTGPPLFNDVASFSSRGALDAFIPNTPTPPDTTNQYGTYLIGVRARIDLVVPGQFMYLAGGSGSSYGPAAGTSFAAPTVAGGVALLADAAKAAFNDPAQLLAATDSRVIKSVLLNSADKTSGWDNGQAFASPTWSTSQSLDYNVGAGRMNLDQAYRQYVNTASNAISQVFAATPTQNVLPTGWARGNLNRPDAATTANHDFFLSTFLNRYTELNATLSWFVNRSIDPESTTPATAEVGFHHLNLEVWRVNGGGALLEKVGEATAPYITTEHLSFLLPQDGLYMIRVVRPAASGGNDPGTIFSFSGDPPNDVYGLAWMARDSVIATSGTVLNPTSTLVTPNAVIAPATNQSATLTYTGSGVTANFVNSIYVGGSDSGPSGGAGTLNVQNGAVVNASNRVRVYPGGSVNLNDGTLTGGVLELQTSSSLTSTGAATLQFTTISTAGSITATAGSTLTMTPIFQGGLLSRINLTGPASIGGDGAVLLSGPLVGIGSLNKVGGGTLALGQTNTYAGGTTISGGTLRVDVSGGLPTDKPVTASGGTLLIPASVTPQAPVMVNGTGSIAGTGTLNGTLLITNGGTLSPGTSPGILGAGNTTFAGGGQYNWQVRDAAGAAGTGYDLLNVTGPLTITATNSNPFRVNLWSLAGVNPDSNGDALNFDNTKVMFWTLVTTSNGISNFDATFFAITVDPTNGTGGFTNDLNGGSFLVLVSGNDLRLAFNPSPEPAHAMLLGLAASGMVLFVRRASRRRMLCNE